MRHGKFLPRYPNYTYDEITGNLTTIQYISVNYVMFGIYQMSQVELISQAGLCCETAQLGFEIKDLWLAEKFGDLIGQQNKFENPLSRHYVPKWTIIACRKIFLAVDFFYNNFKNSHWLTKMYPIVQKIPLSKVLESYFPPISFTSLFW